MLRGKKSFTKRTLKRDQRNNIGYFPSTLFLKGLDPWIKGGDEKRIYEIAKRLVQRGHEVHWFGIKWWDGERDIAVDGVYLHGIGNWDDLYVDGRRSIKEGLYFGFKTLTGLKGDFDVIDCQEFPYFPCFSTRMREDFIR